MVQEPIPQTDDPLAAVLCDLHGAGRLRVWSILISAFGDLMVPRTDHVQASALHEVMERLGIGAGAVRTALSRLGKEGWIIRIRSGRTFAYGLSERAVGEFSLASRQIYAPVRPVPDQPPRLIVMADGVEAAPHPHLIALRRGAALWLGDGPCPAQSVISQPIGPGTLPDWASAALAPTSLRAPLMRIETLFAPLLQQPLSPLDATAARVALIHVWRRRALRHPALDPAFLPDDWPEARCRALVLALHDHLGQCARPWLDAHLPPTKALQNVD